MTGERITSVSVQHLDACEYCDRDDVTLYAWHADVWCADCISKERRLPNLLTGWPDHVPLGRPKNPTYEQPFVWQTPDGAVLRGEPADTPR